ncbi:quinoprotein relay system zinc metallohydrolase 2 [Roseovarius aestuariivivens]|uniref:quinoprotein relay system zinc metallohydrolase 2 n=1 Tax=Roseovarius aestuariivivens TaxID=1888910 RepID=UPI001081FFE4|nr:quinoprotein relay system zinc metallohydrolase 2 [Roseovarius aestuariivivens]
MFEAIVTLCLFLDGEHCRDQLLPGFEADTRAECMAALEARPPDLSFPEGAVQKGAPTCKDVGQSLNFEEVAPGVFVHHGRIEEPDPKNAGDVSNIGFVIGDRGVAVIDSGTARWMGEAIWRSIRMRTEKPVSDVILTHMHPDHVLGASVFAEAGAHIHGHAGLSRALADRRENYLESLLRLIGPQAFIGSATPVVTHSVEAERVIDIGQRSLTLTPWPIAHTPNDLTVVDDATGTLFAGDLVFHRHAPALDGSLLGWTTVLDTLGQLDVARVVTGHGGPVLDWPEGAADTRRYLETLLSETRMSVEAGERLGEAVLHIAQKEATRWELFEAYNSRNATVAFTELEWE